ncbi:hypothetical protein [Flammeovirga kamogawensis]|uniref:Uncharacterized protein n=1 Tax=Flammeovirga kamogawensis TaxID=373891 RepID=A0ABX8GS25_9BACT|nr:hypothetical protein [Flammeovirga kamogawensis]MBB6461452.1 hypothetical protein [Flammeovirga kamogawensis]QWG06346.1 hypothetical protein KM029_13525 [Flammeovirga kamogawensis]TRX68174.1 hypothetical protein EO216_08540 [Flammeovirga kamogawensis]
MKRLITSIFLLLFLIACGTSSENEQDSENVEAESIFDFFEDEEEIIVKEVPKIDNKVPMLETLPTQEVEVIIEKEEIIIEPEKEIDIETTKTEAAAPVAEVIVIQPGEVRNLIFDQELQEVDFQEFSLRIVLSKDLKIRKINISDKEKSRGLLHRYKTEHSYFDVYDMTKAINWSGAGNFAEFGQGFYENSKGVSNGKFGVFAKRRAYSFNAKVAFDQDLNYSNIKKLKSESVSSKNKLEPVKVIFFGKGNLGYRLMYNENVPATVAAINSMYIY